MGFKCGIVGLPNVGKSTLFNALTKAKIEAQNYPFCTIEPNIGIVAVPDERLEQLAAIVKPNKIVPTTLEFVDIAGLVKGAAQGEGLGNKFLANIRESNAIAHVVRCFDNPDIIHVANTVQPLDDIAVINTELLLADLETVEKALIKHARTKGVEKTYLEKLKQHLNNGLPARSLVVSKEEAQFIATLQLITNKQVLYIANVDETGFINNPLLTQVEELAKSEGASVVAICAKIEAELQELNAEEKELFLQELAISEPGLNKVIKAGYKLLGLETYFTAGVQEVRAWTINKNSTAVEAAGVIHTDFAKGFIRAEVIGLQDFINYKGEAGAKEAGKWRLEGKEYIVQDGDVMHFRFNV